MANHFSRRAPHLAARGGFARWQRAAGVAAALGAVALLVIAPLALLIVLAGAIALITSAQVVDRGRRPVARRPARGRAAAVPDAKLHAYTILVPAYQEQDVIGGMVRCLENLDYPKDRLEALILVERRDTATKQAIAAATGAVHPDRGDPAGQAADQAAVLQRRAAAGQGRPDRHLRRRDRPTPASCG